MAKREATSHQSRLNNELISIIERALNHELISTPEGDTRLVPVGPDERLAKYKSEGVLDKDNTIRLFLLAKLKDLTTPMEMDILLNKHRNISRQEVDKAAKRMSAHKDEIVVSPQQLTQMYNNQHRFHEKEISLLTEQFEWMEEILTNLLGEVVAGRLVDARLLQDATGINNEPGGVKVKDPGFYRQGHAASTIKQISGELGYKEATDRVNELKASNRRLQTRRQSTLETMGNVFNSPSQF